MVNLWALFDYKKIIYFAPGVVFEKVCHDAIIQIFKLRIYI